MLFGMVYTPRHSTEAAGSTLRLFTNWQPPVGFKEHWNFATGGGMGLIEADSPAALGGAIAPFTQFFDFKLEQVDSNEDARPTFSQAHAQGDLVA